MRLRFFLLAAALIFISAVQEGRAGTSETQKVKEATEVLHAIAKIPEETIPPALLGSAQAVVVIPNVVKLGFILAGRHGTGIMIGRDEAGEWGIPYFISFTGGSVGWQAGIQATDVILVFKNRKGLEALRKGKFTLGADAAVAAGPVGRQFEAATDIMLKSEIYSYSRSRGLFGGVSFEGSVLQADEDTTERYYGRPAAEVTRANTPMPAEITEFQAVLGEMTQ